MSEKCQLCGSEISTVGIEAMTVTVTDTLHLMRRCLGTSCPIGAMPWVDAVMFDRIQSALALLKRVESGESVEVRKRDGEWPSKVLRLSSGYTIIENSKHQTWRGGSVPVAAAAWNGGEA